MKLEKGMLVSADTCWYVVVNINYINNRPYLECICDNANNIYAFEFNEIHSYMTLSEVGNLAWAPCEREFPNYIQNRKIPYEVIVEVLSGRHDDRFDDWK